MKQFFIVRLEEHLVTDIRVEADSLTQAIEVVEEEGLNSGEHLKFTESRQITQVGVGGGNDNV